MENLNFDLKKEISDMFLSDSRDFLKRFKQLEESATHIGLRSKLLVELLFSLECSLKSLIFLESETDEKSTYKKIKKSSHNIEKLLNTLKEESRTKFNELITIDISIYNVYNRYLLESELVFRKDFGILGEEYYDTISNFQWLNKIYKEIDSFIEFVQTKNPVEIKIIKLSDIDIEYEKNKFNKLKEIIN